MFHSVARQTLRILRVATPMYRRVIVAAHPNMAPLTVIRTLADAAAVAPPKQRRRTLETATKDPIILTQRAAERIQELLGNRDDAPLGIRLGVRRRGCNGLSYTLNYVYEGDDTVAKDITMTSHGVKMWIEPMALFNVVGTTMDWEETELSSEFTFSNPNSKGSCGCGESFNV